MPVSKERVYLDKDGKATREAEDGVMLLVAEGGQISREDADKHGVELAEGDEAKGLTLSHQTLERAKENAPPPLSFPTPASPPAPVRVPENVDETEGDDSPAKGRVFGEDAPEGGPATKKTASKGAKK